MPSKKENPWVVLFVNTILVAGVFMAVDIVYYGLISPGPNPYSQDLVEKLKYTFILSIAFAHLYNKAANNWSPASANVFVFNNSALEGKSAPWKPVVNGIVFSLLTWVVIVFAIALLEVMVSTMYIYILHGIRGGAPGGSESSGVLAAQLVAAGAAVEIIGKTEENPRR